MGMYDTIWVKCPKCGTDIDFQSKSGDCILGNYELDNCPDDVMLDANRHSPMRCDCGAQLEIDRINRSVIVDGAQAEKIKISTHELTNEAPSEACTNTDVMGRSELLLAFCTYLEKEGAAFPFDKQYLIDEFLKASNSP